MRPGRMDKWVTLAKAPDTTPDSDGFFEDLVPKGAWAQIQPLPPQDDGRNRGHLVTIRYRPDITVDVRVLYHDVRLNRDRELFVKGIEDVDEQNAELRLYCEEVA
jgi:head-tail adaptor